VRRGARLLELPRHAQRHHQLRGLRAVRLGGDRQDHPDRRRALHRRHQEARPAADAAGRDDHRGPDRGGHRHRAAGQPGDGVNFQATDDILLYASATRGFKSGGWNSRTAYRPQEFQPMDSEITWSYEAGIKSEFFDRRLRINANAYYAETEGLQLAYSTPGPIAGTTLSTQNNAGDIEAKGLEFELTARLNSYVDVFASLGLQDGEYTDVRAAAQSFCSNGGSLVNGACVPRPGTTSTYVNAIDINDTLSRFPEMNGNIGVNVRFPAGGLGGQFRVTVEAQYTDDFYTTASNAMPNLQLVPNGPFVSPPTVYPTLAPSFTLLNVGIGYESEDGKWRASLDCNNCADEEAVISVFNGLFFNDPRRINFGLNYKF
jgi:iron complex outermembrane receptor protein